MGYGINLEAAEACKRQSVVTFVEHLQGGFIAQLAIPTARIIGAGCSMKASLDMFATSSGADHSYAERGLLQIGTRLRRQAECTLEPAGIGPIEWIGNRPLQVSRREHRLAKLHARSDRGLPAAQP